MDMRLWTGKRFTITREAVRDRFIDRRLESITETVNEFASALERIAASEEQDVQIVVTVQIQLTSP